MLLHVPIIKPLNRDFHPISWFVQPLKTKLLPRVNAKPIIDYLETYARKEKKESSKIIQSQATAKVQKAHITAVFQLFFDAPHMRGEHLTVVSDASPSL
jgi:hypothetical protein